MLLKEGRTVNKNRLEAFSDGVLAIIITIMVLELRVPEEPTWHGIAGVLPTLLSYLLSFVYVGIYWNNHHHLIQLADRVNGTILWANLHLLFWLSLFPFTTRWMDESGFVEVPVLVYGINLLCAAIAFYILEQTLIREQGRTGPVAQALGRDWKGKASPLHLPAGHRTGAGPATLGDRRLHCGGADLAGPRSPRGALRVPRPRARRRQRSGRSRPQQAVDSTESPFAMLG